MSQEEVDVKKRTDWTFFLQRCRRFIPPAPEAHQRFDLVIRVYDGLLDKKTKQPLLRADARLAAKRLRSHIATGCLSDPKDLSLYFQQGKDSVTGFPLYRCVRETNDLEGYHLHMRLIVAWCIPPRLAHLLLLEHNYRWNLRQAVKNRGLDASVGGFYEQPVLEAIQRMTSMLFGEAEYSSWLPTSAYGDTGERNGFVRSVLPGGSGGGTDLLDALAIDENERRNTGAQPMNEVVPLPDLTPSAGTLAHMQGVQVPAMPLKTPAERTQFNAMWLKFAREDGGLDFDGFALAWNKPVASMEEGSIPVKPIFRKSAGHLEAYWKQFHDQINIRETLRPVRVQDGPVRDHLRMPIDVEGPAGAAARAWLVGAPSGFQFPNELGSEGGPLSGGGVDVLPVFSGSSADTQPVSSSGVNAQSSRCAQHCLNCGHKMRVGPYKRYHTQFLNGKGSASSVEGARYKVPAHLHRLAMRPTATRAIRKFGEECACVGDHDHPGGCKSATSSK